MMTITTMHCSDIGKFALQIIQRNASSSVSGVANRGIYLRTESDSTIYLSQEIYRGPLTLNLGGDLSLFNQTRNGHSVLFSQDKIIFPDDQIQIDLQNTRIWQPPSPEGESNLNVSRLRTIIDKSRRLKGGEGSFQLVEQAITCKPYSITDIPGIEDKLGPYFKALKKGDLILQAQKLTGLLGLGPGLTPVGDDFILGALITLNRWGDLLKQGEDLATFNRIILEKAVEKTSSISTSLLTCAAEGAADERIILILDSLFSDVNLPDTPIKDLLAWGSSSGIAVLAGMVSVLSQ